MAVAKAFTILDARGNWHEPSMAAARARGYDALRIFRGIEARGRTGLGFIRPHAAPKILEQNHEDHFLMSGHLAVVQDPQQVKLYDDKVAQFWRYGELMPQTWYFATREKALEFARHWPLRDWIVSKAAVGASSRNVRILKSRRDLIEHLRLCFGRGIEVDHCAGGGKEGVNARSMQRNYVLLQEFIPHDRTWRVNAIGRGRAGFMRYNHPGGHTAQTGNVEPVVSIEGETEQAVFAFAESVFQQLDTNWCALDILVTSAGPRLLETSVGWPWPSPGACMSAPFFGAIQQPRDWGGMWDLMLDEYEAGTWTVERTVRSITYG
jgi:hypothetical protein